MRRIQTMSVLVIVTALTGCASTAGTPLPLVFGQTHTVGISMGATATDQGGEFTLGYRDRNVAVVPVVMSSGSNGAAQLKATATDGYTDALSVLGQFEVKSNATERTVGLGKFFATGLAAKVLADGFSDRLRGAPAADEAAEGQQQAKSAADAPKEGAAEKGEAAGN